MKKIDARGKACPQPVILIKKAMESEEKASILVDNAIARDNIGRFAESAGYRVNSILENQDGIELFLEKGEVLSREDGSAEVVVLIKGSHFGEGDPRLGLLLMKSFLVSLLENRKKTKALIFMNRGVELTTINTEIIEILKEFEGKGTQILSCGTCLDFYNLKDKLKIGQITNMYTSVDLLVEGNVKVITL